MPRFDPTQIQEDSIIADLHRQATRMMGRLDKEWVEEVNVRIEDLCNGGFAAVMDALDNMDNDPKPSWMSLRAYLYNKARRGMFACLIEAQGGEANCWHRRSP